MLGYPCLETDVTREIAGVIGRLDDVSGVDNIDVLGVDFGLEESAFGGEVGELRGGEGLKLAAEGTCEG